MRGPGGGCSLTVPIVETVDGRQRDRDRERERERGGGWKESVDGDSGLLSVSRSGGPPVHPAQLGDQRRVGEFEGSGGPGRWPVTSPKGH